MLFVGCEWEAVQQSGQKHYLHESLIKQNIIQLTLNYSLYQGYFCFDVESDCMYLIK